MTGFIRLQNLSNEMFQWMSKMSVLWEWGWLTIWGKTMRSLFFHVWDLFKGHTHFVILWPVLSFCSYVPNSPGLNTVRLNFHFYHWELMYCQHLSHVSQIPIHINVLLGLVNRQCYSCLFAKMLKWCLIGILHTCSSGKMNNLWSSFSGNAVFEGKFCSSKCRNTWGMEIR